MSRVGYVVAFPECGDCDGTCRLVFSRAEGYVRSSFVVRRKVAVWRTRDDATLAALAFLGTSREPFRVVPVGRRAIGNGSLATRDGHRAAPSTR